MLSIDDLKDAFELTFPLTTSGDVILRPSERVVGNEHLPSVRIIVSEQLIRLVTHDRLPTERDLN